MLCTCRCPEGLCDRLSTYLHGEMYVSVKAIKLVKNTLQLLCSVRSNNKIFVTKTLPGFPLFFIRHNGPARGKYTLQYQLTMIFSPSSFFILIFITTCCDVYTYLFFSSSVLVIFLLPHSSVPALYSSIQSGVSPLCTWKFTMLHR
jgi:hypothetical protein